MGIWGVSAQGSEPGDTGDGGCTGPAAPGALLWLGRSKEPPVPMSQDSGPQDSHHGAQQNPLVPCPSCSHFTLCLAELSPPEQFLVRLRVCLFLKAK